MKHVVAQAIFVGAVLALYFAIDMMRKKDMKHKENIWFVNVCFSSGMWSLGFFGMLIQTDPAIAYYWRALGFAGIISWLISTQYLVCHFDNTPKPYRWIAEGVALSGIGLYFFIIQEERFTFQLTNVGMTYSFEKSIWNDLYLVYLFVVAGNLLISVVNMIKNPKVNRMRNLAKRLLMAEIIILAGMVFATILPMFGYPALPVNAIAQFLGVAVLYTAVLVTNRSRITLDNMSEYIYYSLNIPVMVYDAKEKLKILNDAGSSFMGIKEENMHQVTIEDMFKVTREQVFDFEGTSQNVDAACVHNGKVCGLTVDKICDSYDDIIGYIVVVTDFTERMKYVELLEQARKSAEEANEAKSIFLAKMSHEIRTPMNAIVGFSELLLKMDVADEIRSHVQDIKSSAHNLLAIINDILDISKIESGKTDLVLEKYYTARLLEDVTVIIESQAQKKGLYFESKIDANIPKQMYGDKSRIRGVLINILNNAVKYTDEGKVSLEISILERTEKKIKLAFCVTDTGRGIKPESMDTLFESFERIDEKANYGIEGSGLGLSIVKSYVSLMGGEVRVSSEYGKGSVFTVELEQEIVDNTPMNKEESRGGEPTGKKFGFKIQNVRVLVVDDNPVNLKVARGIMSAYGLNVDTASGGQESIEMCRNCNYNIVFMDQMMPDIDGMQAMQQIRQLNSHYALQGEGKIIVLTANTIKGMRDVLMKQGFDEYLGKPLNIERLESLLCQFIPKENIVFETQDVVADEASKESEEITYIKETIPEIDVDMGISHCGGELDDYLKILEITYKYGEKQLDELYQLWENKAYNDYNIKVHSLKSTSLNIGAKAVSEEAKRQEEAGLKGDYPYIEANIEKLIADYKEVLKKIEEVLVHYGLITLETEEQEKPRLDERMALHMFRNIGKCIDDFDFAKVFSILEESKKFQIPAQYEGPLLKIEELMESLSVDEIREVLKEVIPES